MLVELYTYCRDTEVVFALALALACARAVVFSSMHPWISSKAFTRS